MKRIFFVIILIISTAIFVSAEQYKIILKDGTEIKCDKYQKKGEMIYYETESGLDGFMNEKEISNITSKKSEKEIKDIYSKINKENLAELDKDVIKLLFELITQRYISLVDGQEFENVQEQGILKIHTIVKYKIDIETMKYSVNETSSLIYPFDGLIIFSLTRYVDDELHEKREHHHYYRFNRDKLRWEIFNRENRRLEKDNFLKCGTSYGCYFDEEALKIQDEILK